MSRTESLSCVGCGQAVDVSQSLSFRCPDANEDDDIDHLLRRNPVSGVHVPVDGDENPFVRFRELLLSWQVARARGMKDATYVELVRALDERVAAVDSHGFRMTPYAREQWMGEQLGFEDGGVWVKTETGNVAGSHKARHLFGIALHLLVAEQTGLLPADAEQPLAIASCGNAALAAAVIARALDRPLHTFIPESADSAVVERLRELGARIEVCKRTAHDPPGDPCMLHFRAAVAGGAVPFCCQGSENSLTIDGGTTLGWELVTQHLALGAEPLDRLFVQVGGGALASSTVQALGWAHKLNVIGRVPALHAVQTESAHPLVRAWRRVVADIRTRLESEGVGHPAGDGDRELATWIYRNRASAAVYAALRQAAQHRSQYMWPVEHPPSSVASGILDDETYDWLEVVRAMVESGGWPIIVPEPTLDRARALAYVATRVPIDATGAAGMAGVLTWREAGTLDDAERVGVLFTGASR